MAVVFLLAQTSPAGLTPEQIAAGGATAVLATVVLLFLRGDIVTRKHHDQTVSLLSETIDAKDSEIDRLTADRNLWREIAADALNVSEAVVGRRR